MDNPRWLDEMRRELCRRGLPASYAARVTQELADHQADLTTELASSRSSQTAMLAEAPPNRLGDPSRLVDQIVRGYRRQFFAGRHPLWAFVVAPVATFAAVSALYVIVGALVFGGLSYLVGEELESSLMRSNGPTWAQFAVQACVLGIAYVPPLASVLLVLRSGRRAGCDRRWRFVACGVVAVCAFTLFTNLKFATAPGNGALSIGFGFGWGMLLSVTHWLQLAVPLAVGLAYETWRERHVAATALA